jgi:hypothetical protein
MDKVRSLTYREEMKVAPLRKIPALLANILLCCYRHGQVFHYFL